MWLVKGGRWAAKGGRGHVSGQCRTCPSQQGARDSHTCPAAALAAPATRRRPRRRQCPHLGRGGEGAASASCRAPWEQPRGGAPRITASPVSSQGTRWLTVMVCDGDGVRRRCAAAGGCTHMVVMRPCHMPAARLSRAFFQWPARPQSFPPRTTRSPSARHSRTRPR